MGQPALWRLFASRVPGAAVVLRQVQPAPCDDRFPGEGGPGREIVTRKPQRESIMRGGLRSLTLGSRLELYFRAARCLSSALRDCWHLCESCRGDRGHAHHLQSLAYWVGADALGELYWLPDELPDALHSGARLRMRTIHDAEPELARLPRFWKNQAKGLLRLRGLACPARSKDDAPKATKVSPLYALPTVCTVCGETLNCLAMTRMPGDQEPPVRHGCAAPSPSDGSFRRRTYDYCRGTLGWAWKSSKSGSDCAQIP
jgi:hypothetical protein